MNIRATEEGEKKKKEKKKKKKKKTKTDGANFSQSSPFPASQSVVL